MEVKKGLRDISNTHRHGFPSGGGKKGLDVNSTVGACLVVCSCIPGEALEGGLVIV